MERWYGRFHSIKFGDEADPLKIRYFKDLIPFEASFTARQYDIGCVS